MACITYMKIEKLDLMDWFLNVVTLQEPSHIYSKSDDWWLMKPQCNHAQLVEKRNCRKSRIMKNRINIPSYKVVEATLTLEMEAIYSGSKWMQSCLREQIKPNAIWVSCHQTVVEPSVGGWVLIKLGLDSTWRNVLSPITYQRMTSEGKKKG